MLTTACMLADADYSAEGIAENDIGAVIIPRAVLVDLAGRSALFRSFIVRTYSRRIADLVSLIDDIVFQCMDVRLAERLLHLEKDGLIQATHQAPAVKLGTEGEVFSRRLGEFQRRGRVHLARGEIRVTGRPGLDELARSVTLSPTGRRPLVQSWTSYVSPRTGHDKECWIGCSWRAGADRNRGASRCIPAEPLFALDGLGCGSCWCHHAGDGGGEHSPT